MSTGEGLASRRFRFDKETDLVLVNSVLLAGPYMAKPGEVKEKFSGAFKMFCASHVVTKRLDDDVPQPRLTTFQEHYRRPLKNRRASNKGNIATSGIAGVYRELEEVMDKIVEEVDIMKNEEMKKKKEKTHD